MPRKELLPRGTSLRRGGEGRRARKFLKERTRHPSPPLRGGGGRRARKFLKESRGRMARIFLDARKFLASRKFLEIRMAIEELP